MNTVRQEIIVSILCAYISAPNYKDKPIEELTQMAIAAANLVLEETLPDYLAGSITSTNIF